MADTTLEEALAAATVDEELVTPVNEVLIINPETRTINVPDSEKLFGARQDMGVERKYFKCPRIVGDNIDLSQHRIFVNYVPSKQDGTYNLEDDVQGYWCKDLAVDGDFITFSWEISGNVTRSAGYIAFAVYAKTIDENGNLKTKWHTTIAIGNVLETLPDGEEWIAVYPDIVMQLLERMDALEQGGGSGETPNAVQYVDQTLTQEQQTQARTNIGAASTTEVNEKIDKPLVAKVGQIIAVKAVDEKGKPTEFEAITVAGGENIDVDEELRSYYTTVKEDMANAIVEKGGTAAVTEDFATFPDKIRSLPTEVSPTETLPKQTSLRATPNYTELSIALNWQNVDASGYLVKRKVGGIPQSTADGITVYNGTYPAEEVTDSGLSAGTIYGYRIFPYNAKTQYQARYDGSVLLVDLKDRTGQKQLRELAIDDILCFGSYNGSVLLWKIKDTYDKDLGMIGVAMETNIGNKQFDAPENDSENPNPITNRKNSGNNRMLYSNLFQWANSDAEANVWFQKQHDYDVAPGYASEAGFLNGFTDFEKNTALVDTKLTRYIDQNDGGGTETFYGKMFMPSEALLGNANSAEDARAWEAFAGRSNASRAWQANYWTGTIQDGANGKTSSSVRFVGSSGVVSGTAANYGSNAARLFCQLNASAFVAYSDVLGGYYFVDDTERNS